MFQLVDEQARSTWVHEGHDALSPNASHSRVTGKNLIGCGFIRTFNIHLAMSSNIILAVMHHLIQTSTLVTNLRKGNGGNFYHFRTPRTHSSSESLKHAFTSSINDYVRPFIVLLQVPSYLLHEGD